LDFGIRQAERFFNLSGHEFWIDKDSISRMDAIRNSGNSALLYYNHIGIAEPLYATALVLYGFGFPAEQIVMPVSAEYLQDPKKALDYWLPEYWCRLSGVLSAPVNQQYLGRIAQTEEEPINHVQGYQPVYTYTIKRLPDIPTKLLKPHGRISARDSLNIILSDQKFCYIVAPEGHRSPDGTLQPAEDALGFLIKVADPNILIVPVGFTHLPEYRRLHAVIGEPFTRNDIKDQTSELRTKFSVTDNKLIYTDIAMLRLAEILAEIQQGVYNDSHPLHKRAMQGKLYLGMDQASGKVVWVCDN
jgi:hypothetical protein